MNNRFLRGGRRRNVLMLDESKCIGCHCCEVACKLEHDYSPGFWSMKVVQIGPLSVGENLSMNYQIIKCFHCDRPACTEACPTGAMQKREDGIVFSDQELCIGCRTCSYACPFGIPQLNPATGKIAKCDGCLDRVELGLLPSCVTKCPTGALSFGSALRVVQPVRRSAARKISRTFSAEVPS